MKSVCKDDDYETGFRKYRKYKDPTVDYGQIVLEILLPLRLKEELEREDTATRAEAKRREEERENAEDSKPRVSAFGKANSKSDDWNSEQLEAISRLGFTNPSMEAADAFDGDDLRRMLNLVGMFNREDKERLKNHFNHLIKSGPSRKIGWPDLEKLNGLAQSNPLFKSVVDFVARQVNLCLSAKEPLRIQPMLLLGPPGIGKTHFAYDLAKAMSVPIELTAMDRGVTSGLFSGLDRRWANTAPGLLYQLIAEGTHLNPILVLDELDKASRSQHSDALAPLHNLLEPLSAKSVEDCSVGLKFDASHVVWIATANYEELLPLSLRSRFKVFHIEQATGRNAIEIARSVAIKIMQDRAPENFEDPSKDVIVALAHLSAREVCQHLTDAISKAVADGRRSLTINDLDVTDIDPDKPRLH